jgi:3-hydroxybutyrate dehydrogenase
MLKDRIAIVTGSTSGIGLGIARALAAEGASIVLNGLGDPAAIEQLRAGLSAEFGVSVALSDADMSKPEQVRGMVRQAAEIFGGVDILVNNAGIQHTARADEFPEEQWDAILAINLSAAFHATKAVLPLMRRSDWGRVINVASVHGLVASVHKAAYVAAKHGLVGLTKVIALETAASGITCNAICPGWVLTPLVQRQVDDLAAREALTHEKAAAKLLGEKQPSLQFVATEQIGAVAAFLCSEGAAQMRGACVPVDGGWLAQ